MVCGSHYQHEALFYRGTDDFVDALAPFIADGVDAGEPVLVVVSADKIRRLTRALGRRADHVEFGDMELVGANPARIIPRWREFVEHHAGRPVRGIGEPVHAQRSPQTLLECQQHEALLNVAFDDEPWLWLICPYDLDSLAPEVIHEARRSHPTCVHGADRYPSAEYLHDDVTDVALAMRLHTPPPSARIEALDVPRRESTQQLVLAAAGRAGLRTGRALELALVVSEAVGAIDDDLPVELATWVEDGHVVCQLTDPIPVRDALIGRRRPPARTHAANRCLWLANQLFDLVQVRSSEAGTITRFHVRLPAYA